jgi:uncharacterized protein (DUF2147 family)
MRNSIIILLFITSTYSLSLSQAKIVGKWKTIDDNTEETKSIVEIYEMNDAYYGKILKTFPKDGEDTDPICTECDVDDARYEQKVIGLEIIKGMKKDGDQYSNGNILDPENGNVYRCKIWRENGILFVRGYLGFFYRTQEWVIVE